MKNRHFFYCRYVLGLFVFLFLLSLLVQTGHGEAFANQAGPKPKIGKRVEILKKNLQRLRQANKVQRMNSEWLMDIADVVGTATGIGLDGEPEIRVFTAKAGIRGIPKNLDNFRVNTKVTGRFYALDCQNGASGRCDRPVPVGVSTGHPNMSAGTIGARVTRDVNDDGIPEGIYALSNNHVYAAINSGTIGDSVIQPGTFDGGTVQNDFIGTLADFQPINFCYYWWIWLICDVTNTIDAAIADVVDPSTGEPLVETFTLPDGYGSPNSVLHPAFGDPNVINDMDEDFAQLLGEPVQKYGRTTGLTYGTVNSINATIDVCYDEACLNVARFVDQIIITPGSFSSGGDSGSLIVTYDDNKYPVGLLFAGSTTDTVVNRIDRVLIAFDVDIDSGPTLPSLTINDVTVIEGDGSTIDAVFTVTLSEQSDEVVTVEYATSDNTATEGSDYGHIAGHLIFPAGTTTRTITVQVYGDTDDESDETFYVNLNNAAFVTIADGQAVGTILNDDVVIPPPPEVSIGDVTVVEGNSGTTGAVFTVSLSEASSEEVTVDFVTADDTAIAADDYEHAAGTLTFPIGETIRTITISVYGDTDDEGDETFYVNLTSATGATIADGQALGTITNDDAPGPASGPKLWTGIVTARTDGWTIVSLGQNYVDMVVVCTPNYDKYINTPVTVQVQDALDDSFAVKIAPAVFGLSEFEPPWSAEVHCMAVEAGVYTDTEHGVKMEAVKYTSTVTDRKGSWNGQLQTYANDYQGPVVLGQVMTYNCSDPMAGEDRCRCTADITNPGCYWTVFWSRSASSAKNPPNNTTTNEFKVGKHVGEDTMSWVNDETVGYIVIEAGEGTIGTRGYYAALGADSIRGVGNSPPYTYVLGGLSFQPSTAILSQAAMDGGNGGWAILYGNSPIWTNGSNIELRTAIEEDWFWDSERKHTPEQIAFILFE